ncbi:MAG: hypothetical protein CMN33_02545 [Saprospirales bacterium]|nr:hypothetical protein [Saprospirales bacterium]|tara:strand:+ start:617 stop:1249 length:633 start_codon:yes stop_codon:yes gene_type:complete
MERYIFKETEWYLLTSNIINLLDINKIFYQKSVALVGNSESLLTKEYGNLIDSYDVVCRINRGIENIINNPISSGTKIDILFYAMCRTDIIPFRLEKNVTCIQTTTKNSNARLDNNTFFYNDTLALKSKLNLPKKKIPSTGITAINMIHHAQPKKFGIYGFDFKQTPTYYHSTETYIKSHSTPKSKHMWEQEERFVLDLIKKFPYITLHQ